MYGWRGRIGLIVPASNTTMEVEFYKMAPDGVSIHTTRVPLQKVNVEELESMEKHLVDAAKLLSMANVDVIVFGCTTGSLIKGIGYDREIIKKLQEETNIPSTTTTTAVIEALKALNANKIALATPYIDEVNEREERFLKDMGFEVVDLKSLNILKNIDIGKQIPETVYRLVKSLNYSDADVIFISCTNFRTIEVIEKLEEDLGIPVISSNTASMWMALKLLKIGGMKKKYGKLFETL
ncbi:MAG: maleate cis-trans isomerase [Thermoprotei archaeon]|nr:MAG: maleate cis-trans isomerase [Thermoprotei archaeon]